MLRPQVNVLLPEVCAPGKTLRVRVPTVLESLGAPIGAVPWDGPGWESAVAEDDFIIGAGAAAAADVGDVLGISSAWAGCVAGLGGLAGEAPDADIAGPSDGGEAGALVHGPGGARRSEHPARRNVEIDGKKRAFYGNAVFGGTALAGGIATTAAGVAVHARNGTMLYLIVGGCLAVAGLILACKASGQLSDLRAANDAKRKKKNPISLAIDAGPYRGRKGP